MIWKIVIIVLCLLWSLPMIYMWFSMKRLKSAEDYLEAKEDYLDTIEHQLNTEIKAYHLAIKDIKKDFDKYDDSLNEQRKILNGWQHKFEIMDSDIRKIKKKLEELKE